LANERTINHGKGTINHGKYGPRGRGLGTRFSFRLSIQKLAPGPAVRGRHLRTPPTQPGGSAADGLRRTPQPRRHRCEAAASVGYAHAPGGEATMAKRGAWRLDGGARRVETIAPSSPPPVLLGRHRLAMRRRFLLPPCPSGRRWRRRRHQTCVHRRARWRARPRGERKDALDTVALRRCRAQVVASIAAAAAAAASLGVKPKAEAPHSAPVAPRNARRRRLRRRTCTARARTPRHRAARAQAGQSLRVRAQLLCSARASRRVAKGAGRSMANGEMVGEQRRPPTRLEPAAAGRGGAHCARNAKKR